MVVTPGSAAWPARRRGIGHAVMESYATLARAVADRYRVERELGAGGMATVYLARDLRHDRDVALKAMRPELAESLGAERFQREIRLAARLAHPHILPLLDSGEAGGLLWYAMPVVTGESLRDRLDRERALPVAEAVRLTAEVASALDHAHRQGIVHRDIKPENILLQDGLALVADFGIGRLIDHAGGEPMTQLGVSLGTPAYMSPEQAVGEPLDGRSDLYSLGCVLYECLVGEPPFTGPTVQAVIAKRFVQTPADVQALREGVPRQVATALQRALQRLPLDRFESGADFAAALRVERTAVPAANVPPDGSLAVLAFENLGGERDKDYLGDSIAEEVINALSAVDGVRVAARTSSFAFKGKREDLRVVGERLGVRHVLEGSIRTAGTRMRLTAQLVDSTDGYRLWSERYDRDLTDLFEVQDEIAAAIAQKLAGTLLVREARAEANPELVEALELVARGRAILLQRGPGMKNAITCFERAVTLAPGHAPAHVALGDAFRVVAQYQQGEWATLIPRAKACVAHALGLDPENGAALGLQALLQIQYDQQYAEAERTWQRALERSPRDATMRILRAAWSLTLWQQDDERARAEALRALDDEPSNSFVAALAGGIFVLLDDMVRARDLLDRGVALDPSSFIAHYFRVLGLALSGDWEGALRSANEAMAIFGRHVLLMQWLPECYTELGMREQGAAIRDELLARARTAPVTHSARATAALGLGLLDEAIDTAIASARERDFITLFFLRGRWHERMKEHSRWPEFLRAMGVT